MVISKSWDKALSGVVNGSRFKSFMDNVKKEYEENRVYPEYDKIFEAYKLVDIDKIKVVILGQDPYHTKDMANGLAFSVYNQYSKIPPSLRNIFKEIESETGILNTNKDLTPWAEQGVFLLNTTLTVIEGTANSHKNLGWGDFTIRTIKRINEKNPFVIFLLWGNDAHKYEKYINTNKHKVIKTSHPSPLSAKKSFFGSNQFNEVNEILVEKGEVPIDWRT